MTTIAAGSSQTFTAAIDGTIFTVIVAGGCVGSVTDERGSTVPFSPSGLRRGFGPLDVGQSISVTVQVGSALVTGGVEDGAQFIDPATGAPLSQSGGVATGRTYCRVAHVFGQVGGVSVLPKDFSGNSAAGAYGASMGGSNLPWANAGYLTTYAAGGSSYYQEPASVTAGVNLSTDSWAMCLTVNRASTAGTGADSLIGCTDGSSIVGFYLTLGQATNASGPNRIGARLYASATSQLGSTYATGTVADAADHRIAVTFDATSAVLKIYVDGALAYTSSALTISSTDVMTGAMRFGQALTGGSADCKFGDSFGFYVFAGAGLPMNIANLIAADNTSRKTSILAQPVFI